MAENFGRAVTYEAVNRYGNVVHTFSNDALAQTYKSEMAAMGSPMMIRQARHIVSYTSEGSMHQRKAGVK